MQEKHDLFANGLALILPDTAPNKRDMAIRRAYTGKYCSSFDSFWGGDWFFTGPKYWRAQQKAIEELWQAVYGTAAK